MSSSKRWTIGDRYHNLIYLTEERWEHIIEPMNHPEMALYELHLQETIRTGRRHQAPLNPHKYLYGKAFDDLAAENTDLVAVVLFGFREGPHSTPVPNHYIVTAYQYERK